MSTSAVLRARFPGLIANYHRYVGAAGRSLDKSGQMGWFFLTAMRQIPWALRPVMPWGIYVLPLLAMLPVLFQLNPAVGAAVPLLASRLMLSACGAVALISSLGMVVEWIVWQENAPLPP